MHDIVSKYLDPSCVACVQGGIPETAALLDQKWDKIFYTGSATVAKIIAKKAAETLTPCTFELGGKNPAIVTKNANIPLAARRLLWGKSFNAGQVCVSQNYIVIDKTVLPRFVSELAIAMKEFFPNGARHSEDYSRIINKRQFQRLKNVLRTSKGKILLGGTMDEERLFVEPTVVQVDSISDSLLVDETFGPFLTLYPVSDLTEAIQIVKQVQKTPLAAYPFGTKAEVDQILTEIRSGGASVNDSWMHTTVPTLPFGGIGESGTGTYRGKASFDCFTHCKSYTTTPSWAEGLLSMRYPPYRGKLEMYQSLTKVNPNFDRDGRVDGSLGSYVSALSSGGSRMLAMLKVSIGIMTG